MKNIWVGIIAACAVMPTVVQAQAPDEGRSPLAGVHVGVDVSRDFNESSQTATSATKSRPGFGGRIHAGYDAVFGGIGLIGAEIGLGVGGRDIVQPSLAGGSYTVNPGFTYDVSARAGIVPATGLALYGRAGYRWLRVEQTVAGQLTGNGTTKLTEKGFTYGVGVEYALSPRFSVRAEFNRTKFSPVFRQNKVSIGASFRF